ncbi:MAG: sugar ABC transporter substrate-binding protein [Tannerellaceae bacterium]|jgi:ABC-type sugar transport system substrate-binding protein|nr:sugar ABC transporter substrate-binding protein [Tannerellaceae bacterium]
MRNGFKIGTVIVLMAVVILGCAKKDAAERPYTVGLAFGGLDATPTVLMGYLTARMDELGWRYVITNADLDLNKTVSDIENLVQQRPDFILSRPPNQLVQPNVAQTCLDAKVPVAFMSLSGGYDIGVEATYARRPTELGDPEILRGIPLATFLNEYVATHPGFVPKIAFLVGDIAIDAREICERSINIRDNLTVQWEEVITTEALPNWSANGAMKVMEDWIQKYPISEMNTIVCWSDEMCVGVVQALQAAGKNPDDYLVLSYDGLPIIEEYVSQGWVDATSAFDLKKQAVEMIKAIEDYKAGKTLDQYIYATAIYVMTPGNLPALKAGQSPDYWDYSSYIK